MKRLCRVIVIFFTALSPLLLASSCGYSGNGGENASSTAENTSLSTQETSTQERTTKKETRKESGDSSSVPPHLILVNRDHKIPKGYRVNLKKLSDGHLLNEAAHGDAVKMIGMLYRDGLPARVLEAYRTYSDQVDIFEWKKREFYAAGYRGEELIRQTRRYAAYPDESEHRTGLAMDIGAVPWAASDRAVYAWLRRHAYEYGFVLRFPDGKEHITGAAFEPWHYRYVGRKAAKYMTENSLTLEEFTAKLKNDPGLSAYF